MAVTRYRSIEEVPAPQPPPTAVARLRLAFSLSKTCLALARAAGAPVARPQGEALPSGRVWRWEGPRVSGQA